MTLAPRSAAAGRSIVLRPQLPAIVKLRRYRTQHSRPPDFGVSVPQAKGGDRGLSRQPAIGF